MSPLRTVSVLVMAALALATPRQACAQASAHRPEPWLLSVGHRIDLQHNARRMVPAAADADVRWVGGSRFVFNLTAGVLVDAAGHVVTRLVNLDPTAPEQDIKVTTSTGNILDASFVGLDQPTGLVVLSVPGLRGVAPATPSAALPRDGDAVRVVSAVYPIKEIRFPIERVAIYPKLTNAAGHASTAVPPALARGGVVATIESAALTSLGDLSIVEAKDGTLLGIALFVSPGRGSLMPVAFVRDVVAGRVIAANGSVQAGWLGAVGTTLAETPEATRPAWARGDGVLIQNISANGPAEHAGLERNDVIVSFDDAAVRSTRDLATAVGMTPGGTKISIGVLREGKPLTLACVLGGQPLAPGRPAAAGPTELQAIQYEVLALQNELRATKDPTKRAALQRRLDDLRSRLPQYGIAAAPGAETIGVRAHTATEQMAARYGTNAGVFVDEVTPSSPAAAAGLSAFDLIVRAGGSDVADESALDGAVRRAINSGAGELVLEVRREAAAVTVLKVALAVSPKRATP